MADDSERALLIGRVRGQLAKALQDSGEGPITVDGQPVTELVYSHDRVQRGQGFTALVAALETSPYRARYELMAFAEDELYGDAALDAIDRSFEAEKEAAQ